MSFINNWLFIFTVSASNILDTVMFVVYNDVLIVIFSDIISGDTITLLLIFSFVIWPPIIALPLIYMSDITDNFFSINVSSFVINSWLHLIYDILLKICNP